MSKGQIFMISAKTITLDHGSGGLASQQLIGELFLKYLANQKIDSLEDCAILGRFDGEIALSTDSFVVDPLFFPGGDIGELAINGTINDLAMRGAKPVALSLALILEEGFAVEELERIMSSIANACEKAGVFVVTGDTKVVQKGKADKIFINTTGVGVVSRDHKIAGHQAEPGDAIIVSGTIGDHGITIMSSQAGLDISGDIKSDTRPLHTLVEKILAQKPGAVHVLRDPTRGGVATTLSEIAGASRVEMVIEEKLLPISPSVKTACEMIGLDPLYLANEGKFLLLCKDVDAAEILDIIRKTGRGKDAAIIGRVTGRRDPGRLVLTTAIGGTRLLEPLTGMPLPRIC